MKSIKKHIIIYIAITIIITVSICFYLINNLSLVNAEKQQGFKLLSDKGKIIAKGKLPLKDTTVILDNRKVYIKITSKKSRGTFLLLHGWNLPATDWCDKTSICEKLLNKGFNIVSPDMGKSVYQGKNYFETRIEWRNYPTRMWLSDTLIPFLQKKYSLFLNNEKNYLVGLSTGARGVALVLLDFPDLFKGAAALSGD
ncbi:MAG: esterase family protein, partial [Bacteroidetes bacterium]|nr:esterase family protein [Bacteroidota bacterium]